MPAWGEKPIVLEPSRLIHSSTLSFSTISSHAHALLRSSRRRPWIALVVLAALSVLALPLRPPLPPSYAEEWAVEKYLPQVDPRATFPEGADGRYVRFRPIKETGG